MTSAHNSGCAICLKICCYFLEVEHKFIVYFLQCMFPLFMWGNLKFDCLWLNIKFWFIQFQIYTDSAEAKIPSVLDYLGTVIEVLLSFTSLQQWRINTFNAAYAPRSLWYVSCFLCMSILACMMFICYLISY